MEGVKTKIVMVIVTLTIGIIMAGSLLMPVIQDVAEPSPILVKNNGSTNAAMIKNNDTGSIIMDGAALKITINGTLQTYAPSGAVNVLYGENVLLIHNNNGTTFNLITKSGGTLTTTSSLTEISYSAANDKLTIIAGSDILVVDLGLTLIWGDSGDYTAAFKQNGSTVYYSASYPYLLNTSGISIKNGVPLSEGYTVSDTSAIMAGSQDIYTVKYSTADYIIKDSEDNDVNAGAWMMVPKEVHGIGLEKIPNEQKAIYLAIPALVMIALIVVAANMFSKRE